jgi:hypothetical protein
VVYPNVMSLLVRHAIPPTALVSQRNIRG